MVNLWLSTHEAKVNQLLEDYVGEYTEEVDQDLFDFVGIDRRSLNEGGQIIKVAITERGIYA
jgi:hypothetical protein